MPAVASSIRLPSQNSINAVSVVTMIIPKWIPAGVSPKMAMMTAYAAYVPGNFML